MAKDDQIVVRVSASLKANLKRGADDDSRAMSDFARRLLVDAVAARIVEGKQEAA